MRGWQVGLVGALAGGRSAPAGKHPRPPGGASGTTGGAGAAGAGAGGMAGMTATPDAGMDTSGMPMMGGKALLVTGTIPLVGTDVVFEAAFKARGLEVEIVQEKDATPMHAMGKRVVMLSYGMTSTAFKAEAYTDIAVPMIVTEQNLLPRLKMSSAH